MSFGDRARKGLAGLVLLGASAGLGGCGALIDFAAQENAAHVRGHYEVEAAKIRAGQTKVNGVSQIDQNCAIRPDSRSYIYAAFNNFEDTDGNGLVSQCELKGAKDNFTVDEPFIVSLFSENPIVGLSYTLKRDGEIIDCVDNATRNLAIRSCGAIYNAPGNPSSKNLSPGTYLAMWQNRDHLLGIIKFDVTPKPSGSVVKVN